MVPRLSLITQNVDDLHERAGSPDVQHLHGLINKPICFACRRPYDSDLGIPDEPEGGRRLEPPRCKKCNGKIRPGVVWFGENLPSAEWKVAREAATQCDAFLSIGTSSVVQPAAQLPLWAFHRGALMIQINPKPTTLDDLFTLNLNGAAGVVLPQLVDAFIR